MSQNILKRAIKFAYKRAPQGIQTKIRNLANTDNFYTLKEQNLINSIAALSAPISDKNMQKAILKRYLQAVEIEIASFCNRTCWFCPNTYIDRKSKDLELPEETFLKLLHNLAEIEYDKMLTFHRYNEPLANRELILRRVRQAREILPKALLVIYTNGDYASREYFEVLRDAGINSVMMAYYFGKKQGFDRQNIISAVKKMSLKLGLEYEVLIDDLQEYRARFKLANLTLYYRAWNPDIVGVSRGGSIKELKKQKNVKFGCFQPAMTFNVDHNGLVMPCCNTRSDEIGHKDFILGDCNTQDLFEIFFSPKAANLRRELFSSSPCAHFTHKDSIAKICSECIGRRAEEFVLNLT